MKETQRQYQELTEYKDNHDAKLIALPGKNLTERIVFDLPVSLLTWFRSRMLLLLPISLLEAGPL